MPNNSDSANQLIGEKSPYLLQHAYNPVNWYPWGKAAFEKAKREDRPILLSIGYSTCHWCHVMAHESFEDRTIAKMINDHFIPVKVDREERPDIDHIYMSAVTAMTGQGGWPLTVFITPQGDPFFGGTYFPPYAKWGNAGFADLLNSIAEAWRNDRSNVLSSGQSMTQALRQGALKPESSGLSSEGLNASVVDKAFLQIKGQYDPVHGGFGSAPKFPMGHNLSFLLRCCRRSEDPQVLNMVRKTLTAMAAGGIWDHLGGGFHRYSTDQFWHVPHFEKMLYDQALLSRSYLESYQTAGAAQDAQVAREILDYVLKDMTAHEGGFYSAEDADSLETGLAASGTGGHLKEGAFYVFSQPEIESALGEADALIFNYCYGVLAQGNVVSDPHGEFSGKNILYRAHSAQEAAEKFAASVDEIQSVLNESRKKLLDLRNVRPRPHRDEKVLCDWNGLMIASFAFAGRVLGESRYKDAAVLAADFILAQMTSGRRLLHRWKDGGAGIAATLEDYAFFIYGLLEVYEATFNEKYLKAAVVMTDGMIENFADSAGGFYMTAADAELLIIRPKEIYDGALPSGNSVAAFVLLKLHALTQKDDYLSQAQRLFRFFASSVEQAPYAHSFLLSALDWYLQGPMEIALEGRVDDPVIAKMLKVLYKHFIPFKAVKFIPSVNAARALICRRGTCKAPVSSVSDFEKEIVLQSDLSI